MAEKSLFQTTNGTGDGTGTGYTSDEIVDWLRETFLYDFNTEGVIPINDAYATPLAVAAGATSSHTATVAAGRAWVYGFPYWNTASVTVTFDAEEANPRIDRVVLRASWAAQTVRITAIKGTAAASPTAPAITQTADTTWDIKLAQVRLNADGTIVVTDERTYWAPPIVINRAAQIGNDTIDSAHYAAGSIDTEHYAANSVDDTVVGNRVPQFYRRQGGSATAWATAGTTSYTPTTVRMQAGCVNVSVVAATYAYTEVTFPTAFSNSPVLLCVTQDAAYNAMITPVDDGTAGCLVYARHIDGTSQTQTVPVFWLAIGPE